MNRNDFEASLTKNSRKNASMCFGWRIFWKLLFFSFISKMIPIKFVFEILAKIGVTPALRNGARSAHGSLVKGALNVVFCFLTFF